LAQKPPPDNRSDGRDLTCCETAIVRLQSAEGPSSKHLEDRQRQHGLREEADGEGERTEYR
jgi:hypothetical protein